MIRVSFAVLAALLLGACATTEWPRVSGDRYDAAIASPVRTDQDRRMDASRKPAEFLPFTGVGPGMRVLDVSTGGGYTSQLLALVVGPEGRLYAQSPNPGATAETVLTISFGSVVARRGAARAATRTRPTIAAPALAKGLRRTSRRHITSP